MAKIFKNQNFQRVIYPMYEGDQWVSLTDDMYDRKIIWFEGGNNQIVVLETKAQNGFHVCDAGNEVMTLQEFKMFIIKHDLQKEEK